MAKAAVKQSKRLKSRDPVRTRTAILDAATSLLAAEGRDALNISRVAKLAGVNRGTAYLHFRSRETLTQATLEAVSRKLCERTFVPPEVLETLPLAESMSRTYNLARFAVENPALGQIWLNYILTSERGVADPFWDRWHASTKALVASPYARPGVDAEVLAVVLLSAYFTWPIWAEKHLSSRAKSRRTIAVRLGREMSRLILAGVMRPDWESAEATVFKKPCLGASQESVQAVESVQPPR